MSLTKKQVAEIVGKYLHRAFASVVKELGADFSFKRREQQTAITVCNGICHDGHRIGGG